MYEINCTRCDRLIDEYACPSIDDDSYFKRCIHCGDVFFLFDDEHFDIGNSFEPAIHGELVNAVMSRSLPRLVYRRAPLIDDALWTVFITQDASEVRAFKNKSESWVKLRIHSYARKDNREQVEIPRRSRRRDGKPRQCMPKIYSLAKRAWNPNSFKDFAPEVICHKDDQRHKNGASQTTVENHSANAEQFHDARRQGILSPSDLIDVPLQRRLVEALRAKHGKKNWRRSLEEMLIRELELES